MTSTILGDAKWKTCWKQASYLSKYIYKHPPGPGGFKTEYPDKMAKVEELWAVWAEQNDQASSGLVARLFKLKAWDPNKKNSSCPPCLVFRGTDFEDMRGLAFCASVRISWGIVCYTIQFNKVFDPSIKPKMSAANRARRSVPVDFTREEIADMGFVPINILTETGAASVEGFTDGTQFNLTLRMSADIMAREEGDWLNNLNQGLGRGSAQYNDAIAFGKRCVREKIISTADKRLEISGHSLGGGLAAAVCCLLDAEFTDITFHAITFNAAGVHSRTVRPASLSDGVINNFTVEDEILTTLQSYTSTLPFIGSVFVHASRALGMKAMPPALGTMQRVAGRSPGGSLGAKGSALANLFPVQQQTLKPGAASAIPVLSALDQMLGSSPSLAQFGTRFGQWLNQRYRATVMRENNPWHVGSLYTGMFDRLMAELAPELALVGELFAHSAEYHGMDVVIATYEAMHPDGR